MANWKKIGWIAGIGAGSLTGLFFLARGMFNKGNSLAELQKLATRLETIPSAKIHKVNLTGLTIRLDVKLKNPTLNGFKMKYPFLKVVLGGKTIGSSQAVDKEISVPPNGEANLTGIMFHFPAIGALSLIKDMLAATQSGTVVKLGVVTTTTIDPLWRVDPVSKKWEALKDYGIDKLRVIPYNNEQDVTLMKGAV